MKVLFSIFSAFCRPCVWIAKAALLTLSGVVGWVKLISDFLLSNPD